MTTIKIAKRYVGNGTTKPRKEANYKLKIIDCPDRKCGKNWGLVYEDGHILNLHMATGSRNGFRKSEINIITK